ncbi:hypothetical protein MK805_07105 [Shimazuella sp. AN120528]|uniref:hypothetical protein n=1 Tax=Shimazuella soli TaxID=1892854 RepID=UPI001F107F0E|nr:hypothetical protein [Shimazuella soli]MCH5584738.1 hypothetical protein [Shimazuella soli]
MYKTVGIYTKITDKKKFEKYYVENILPRMIKFPGVIKLKITHLITSTREIPASFQDIKFVIETYYETIDDVRQLVNTTEGKEIVKMILDNPYGTCGRYIGEAESYSLKNTKTFDAQS